MRYRHGLHLLLGDFLVGRGVAIDEQLPELLDLALVGLEGLEGFDEVEEVGFLGGRE